MQRQHRPGGQQAGELEGETVTGVGWLAGARELILLVQEGSLLYCFL